MSVHRRAKRLSTPLLTVAAAAILWLALSIGEDAPTILAQNADNPTPVPTQRQPDNFGGQNLPPIEGKFNPPQYAKLDSNLNRIVQQAQSGMFTAQAAASNAPVNDGASVAVTLYLTEGYASAISGFLSANGASPRNIGADYIEAYVPVSLLPAASRQEGVIAIRAINPPQPAQGTVISEGAAVHGAPAWNTAGYRGRGVKIGVIDAGFKDFRKLMGTEMPSSVTARCYTDVGVFTSVLEDCTDSDDLESTQRHGTAVTEAIFDIAPEATYYVSNPSSSGDLNSAVNWMVSQGVDVINQSLGWIFTGPGDGTSYYSISPLSAVNTAVSGGITWVNSAGNGARTGWTGAFADASSDSWHEFSGADECVGVSIQLTPKTGFLAQLRWDNPWGGADSDLDLYLIPITGDTLDPNDAVRISQTEQAGNADDIPYELIGVSYNSIPNGAYCLAIHHNSGTAPTRLQIQVWGGGTLEHYTPKASIGNPAESSNSGLLAVGAARWSSVTTIESFSSRGPTQDGRTKPDIVGADGGKSVSYRSTGNSNGNWYGTSQSSPHVAGLAALVKQRFPTYSAAQVATYLKDNAEARGTVPNNTWGHGFVKLPASNLPQATATHTPTHTATHTPQPTATHTPQPTATHTPQPTATHTPQPTATHTPQPTATHTPQPTATHTHTPTTTHTPQPTATNTPQPTATHTPQPTATHTPQPTATHTPQPTATHTPQPTATHTPTHTATPSTTLQTDATHTPTATHTATATHTPTPTAAPQLAVTHTPQPTATHTPSLVHREAMNRLSALETILVALQSLLAALESKVAALEAREPIHTPTPEPTPTPAPITDACMTTIAGDGAIAGAWDGACPSTNRPAGGDYYARYYAFSLSKQSDVTITLESAAVDTFLYLLEGAGRTGAVAHENDDSASGISDSRIEQALQAGSYTIEATTHASGITGDFTLTVSGIQ